jgi:hypothetical protein
LRHAPLLRGHAAAYAAFRSERDRSGLGGDVVTPEPLPFAATMQVQHIPIDSGAACATLVNDPRHAAFARTLMLRPPAKWLSVTELARAADVALPGVVMPDVLVAWLAHPSEAASAVIVFLSPSTRWRAITLCDRARW